MVDRVRPRNLIGSVDKAIKILSYLAGRTDGATLMEVSKEFGWPHSTVHHILATLKYHGFVQQIPPRKRYHLGISLFELGQRVLENISLVEMALPHLRQLADATGETANMAVLDGLDIVHIAQVPSQYIMKALTRLGGRVPAYCTALGKCLLSGKTDDEVHSLYSGIELGRLTPNTITDIDSLIDLLRQVRVQGYALDNQEREASVCCIAAPLRTGGGSVLAAVSVSGPASRLRTDDPNAIRAVTDCAAAISQQLKHL